ncbi:hypothetical protein ACU4GH_28710 [Bradyrhizobium betae]
MPKPTVEAIADLVAAAAGGTAEIVAGLERAERHLYLPMIKRRIANNLETDALTTEELCRHFHISRATLYRLFEAEGGLAHYVREQRLNLAFRRLISPSATGRASDRARRRHALQQRFHLHPRVPPQVRPDAGRN